MTELTQFINKLGAYRGKIKSNTLKTLKGQALAGDLDGAKKGLDRIIKKAGANDTGN